MLGIGLLDMPCLMILITRKGMRMNEKFQRRAKKVIGSLLNVSSSECLKEFHLFLRKSLKTDLSSCAYPHKQ